MWSVCTVICGSYAGYNTWHQYTYPGVETPFDRHNESYVKPFMKKNFNKVLLWLEKIFYQTLGQQFWYHNCPKAYQTQAEFFFIMN